MDKLPKKVKKEGNKYDKVMKENIENMFISFLFRHIGLEIAHSEALDPKMQTTLEWEMDFIRKVITSDGDEFILHIEFQTTNEKRMVYRIQNYHSLLLKKYNLRVRHIVIYLGSQKMTMPTMLPPEHVFYGFEILSLYDLDVEKLLASEIPDEIIFAILADFKGENSEATINLILSKLKEVCNAPKELKKYIHQLEVLSKLRNLEASTKKITKDMPIIIEFTDEDRQLFKKGVEKGVEKGRKEAELEKQKMIDDNIRTMLLDKNLSLEKIAKYSNTSIDYVNKIKIGLLK